MSSCGQMGQDMKASGERVKLVVQEDRSMQTVIAMKACGGRGKHAVRAYTSMLTGVAI